MKTLIPFTKNDLMLIKGAIIFALSCIVLVIGIYFIVGHFENQSIISLGTAQAGYEQARYQEDAIEEEEATIVEYIDRYLQLTRDGAIAAADRLQFNETVAEIRKKNNLFPVSVTIGKQNRLALKYNPEVREPGSAIELNSSSILLSLPLLHEQDLGRLLRGIFESPGLFQAKECRINLKNELDNDFTALDRHLSATCTIYWYTFNLNPEVERSEFL